MTICASKYKKTYFLFVVNIINYWDTAIERWDLKIRKYALGVSLWNAALINTQMAREQQHDDVEINAL